MVSLIDVVRFLRKEFPDLNIYPTEFPLKSPTEAVKVEMTGNTEAISGVFPATVQVKVRGVHPEKAEATSYRFKKLLDNKTNFTLGDVQVIFVKSQNPVPLSLGRDVSGNYLYSNNFRFMMNEGE